MKPAIIEPAITQLVAEARELVSALRDAEREAAQLEQRLVTTREAAQMRRIELGRALLVARARLPKRGTRENGWGAYLEAIEVDEATAWRYMRLAAGPADAAIFQGAPLKDSGPERGADAPPLSDEDQPPEVAGGPEPEPQVEIDRDTWCTPKWITDAIGEFDLDPCGNERSTVRAIYAYRIDRGEDGLKLGTSKWMNGKSVRVFVNPPYSGVLPWIEAYAHTRFCFLLKFDPSTKWFATLLEHTQIVLVPRGTRIQFEPPPGVPPEKAVANQFPHALFYARAADATKAIRELCYPPWSIR